MAKITKYTGSLTRILLISDTHGHLDEKILRYVEEADEVWHAGDIGTLDVAEAIRAVKPLRAVYGNIDNKELRAEFPLDQRFTLEGMRIWMTHIAGSPRRYNARVRDGLKDRPADVLVCGHSHILKVQYLSELKLMHLNPGAVGKHGFHKARTMLRFKIDQGRLRDMEVIEFPR